jgi:Zn-dependent M28 family amino/carboxypeptidase
VHTRPLSLIALALVAAACTRTAVSRIPAPLALPAIDSMALRSHTFFLAHDLLEGRGTGRRGADVAALYLASEAERIGLQGAGPGGSFFQVVPIIEATVDSARTRLALTDAGIRQEFLYGPGFIPNVGTARTLIGFGGEPVYVGSAQDVLAAPGRLPPLAGRVALLSGMFGADAAAADTLRARGASGVVHLVGDDERYQLYVRSRGPSRMFLDDEAAVSSFIPDIPAVIASPSLERALLSGLPGAGEAAARIDRPVVLTGKRVDVTLGVTSRRPPARNVAALLRGSDPALADEFVIYTAHYDHLGISTPDAAGDSIYNGFSDDAAGAAMLLAIAQAMQQGARPQRSMLFLFLTGEERGLLGSDWYAAHPLFPPARTVAGINLDAGAPPAPSVHWRVAGGDRSTLGATAVAVAARAGWEAQTAPATPNSDYFPLLRIGIPAVFLVPGPGAFEAMTAEASNTLRRRWDTYHQPADHWHADFPFSGLVRYADYAYRLGLAVAGAERPTMLVPR